ncbi:hypothetical protein [Streptomyces sp. NPDC001594]|uniref:hypothetical protein n=1 Tax=Streptomyces sp. NPDC001594 TaxID=3364590 RepID=UPI0036C0615A
MGHPQRAAAVGGGLPSPDSGENDAAAFYRQALASGGLANIARTADRLRGHA